MQKTQFEAQRDIELENLRFQHEVTLLQMKDATTLEAARITAAKESSNIAQEAAEERLSTGLEQQHEVGMAGMQAAASAQQAAQTNANGGSGNAQVS